MTGRFLSLLFPAAFLLSGCMSQVSVKKVDQGDKTTPGIRYSLPATFILGTPKEDGTIESSIVKKADPEKTYAVQSSSFLSAQKLNVLLEEGLLKKVETANDDTEVAKALVESGGKTLNSYLEQLNAAEAAKAREKKESGEAARKEEAVLKAELTKSEAAVQAAEDRWSKADYAWSLDPEDKAAKIARQNAKVDLDRALQQARDAQRASNASSAVVGGNVVKGGGKALGPVLYRVVNTRDSVVLNPVTYQNGTSQQSFATARQVSQKPAPTPFQLWVEKAGVVTLPAKGGPGFITIKSSVDLVQTPELPDLKWHDETGQAARNVEAIANLENARTLILAVQPGTPPGGYLLRIAVQLADSGKNDGVLRLAIVQESAGKK